MIAKSKLVAMNAPTWINAIQTFINTSTAIFTKRMLHTSFAVWFFRRVFHWFLEVIILAEFFFTFGFGFVFWDLEFPVGPGSGGHTRHLFWFFFFNSSSFALLSFIINHRIGHIV
jgi:hypothetical protein